MNLLGKLLIVLIFIGSIVLASFSVVLNVTHTNWKKRAEVAEQNLKTRTEELARLQKTKDSLETALRLEIRRQVSRVVALEEETAQLKLDNQMARDAVAALDQELEKHKADVRNAHAVAETLQARLDATSKALFEAQKQWVEMSTDLSKKMDEANGLAIQLTHYQAVAAQLAKDYGDAVEVLRLHGKEPNPALYPERPPAGVIGTVTEVREKGNIEISIGSDSGLARGQQLDVVRTLEGRASYVGKAEIIDTAADRAVAKMMPEFNRGTVRLGDTVTYIEVSELVAH